MRVLDRPAGGEPTHWCTLVLRPELTAPGRVAHNPYMSLPPRSRNSDVATMLEEIGDLLEIKGEQGFRVNAYRNAARRIEGLREPIEQVHAESRLRTIQGIGPALEQKIGEFLTTGSLQYLEKLRAEFPPGLVELLTVPGLGPRKARLVFDQLGVTSLAELEAAARAHRLQDVPGLGEKTEERLLAEIERLKLRVSRHQLGRTLQVAEELVAEIAQIPQVEHVAYVGSLRRMLDTIGNVNLLVATNAPELVGQAVLGLGHIREVREAVAARVLCTVRYGVEVDLRFVAPGQWAGALLYFTGSKAHVGRLQALASERGWRLDERGLDTGPTGPRLDTASEDDVYAAFGLQPIPPELREDKGEIELARDDRLPRLIELSDIRGDLHVHSDWSDGGDTIEAMALAARALGRGYIALTDHSKSLGVARGLTEERVAEQRHVIDGLNARLAPFRILHGTEMDIKRDGALDYEDATLAIFDYVSASIHSAMAQEQAVMTARIQRALSNPWVTTLNHPHGRLVGSRAAYAVDMDAVIATAVAQGVALELNAQPERMDLDGEAAFRARVAGARFTISTDSHATGQLSMMRFGVATARRAWLGPSDVLNVLPLDGLLAHLAERRRRAEAG
ncbi:MAG: DNA polymerase/3'-5' exonuclease PolX [Chloroflexi bacterium]|nr:DNA polymerase/3'-5' exonuclease PolX [Chloroflexota bacterium]